MFVFLRPADVTGGDLGLERQGWSSRVERQEPEPPNIKEEEQEAEITEFQITGVIVKSEDVDEQGQ